MTDQPAPKLEDLQHWTWLMGRTQQMMMEAGLDAAATMPGANKIGRAHV